MKSIFRSGFHSALTIAATLLAGWFLLPSGFLSAQEKKASKPKAGNPAVEVRLFENAVAPLLRRHCLECHGPNTRKARLDLSSKKSAWIGGRGGKVIVPGRSADSRLWKVVAEGEMPPKGRPQLSPREKQLLRDWLDAGAPWSAGSLASASYSDQRIEPHREFAGDGPPDPGPILVRRLTFAEYVATVRQALSVDIRDEARKVLPADVRADGFSNTAYNLHVDLSWVEAHARLARIIADRLDLTRFLARFAGNSPVSRTNRSDVVARMGKWLLRGPLERKEIDSFLRIAAAVDAEKGTPEEAYRFVIEAMLQSPRFLYRIENHRGDGSIRFLNHHELASRLSYLVWGGPPDEELMRAADAGQLADRSQVAAQVGRMLEDPRAREKSAHFIRDWMHLDRLGNLRPNPEKFPRWSPHLADDMRRETLAYFHYVAWEKKLPLTALFDTQVVFATPRLAQHYGLPQKLLKADFPAGKPNLEAVRVESGLQALYAFREGKGKFVRDLSGNAGPLDLTIADPAAVRWTPEGLTLHKPAILTCAASTRRMTEALKKSGALTLEAWVTPADTTQKGPARIFSFSNGPSERNFTLGQEGDAYEVRLRTRKTSTNGMPALASPRRTASTRRTHIVYTRDARGQTRLFLDGEETASRTIPGDLKNWDDGFRLVLGNETTADRPWRGTFHLVALFDRALEPAEIRRNHAAGPAFDTNLYRFDVAGVSQRGGLLTQGSTLTVGGDEASMVARGLFVLHDILSSKVDDPPPCVDTTPLPTKSGRTNRDAALTRLADRSCSGCHARFEPLAFGLEKFDGTGFFRQQDEHGNTLREDGEILFPNQEKPRTFATSAELMKLLAGSERVREALTLKVVQFALGRPLVRTDSPALREIHRSAWQRGGTYADLVSAIAVSDLVLKTRTEKTP